MARDMHLAKIIARNGVKMNIPKLVKILAERREVYQRNADDIQWMIDVICRFELYKNTDGKVFTIDDSEFGPDKNIIKEVIMEYIKDRNETI